MKVEEIMTREVLTIGPEGEVRDVARILVENHISGLPVCNAQRQVVGVISEGDILFKEQTPAEEGRPFLSRFASTPTKEVRKARAIRVDEAMTAPAITISSYFSVAEAARLMSEHGVNRLPVLKGGKLVGIVTRGDLVRAFVRSDEDIRREIQNDVVLRTLLLETPAAIEVEVERGVVRLSGELETRSDALVLERLAARVPGVVTVASELRWKTDDTTRRARRELRSTQEPIGR